MKEINLRTLGLKPQVADNVHYYDLGYVKSAAGKNMEINDRYGVKGDLEGLPGGMRSITDSLTGERHIYIFYERLWMPGANIFVRAHEETHALIDMRQGGLLEDAIERHFGKMAWENHEENAANLGGIYALHLHKIPLPLRYFLLNWYKHTMVNSRLRLTERLLRQP